MEKEVSGPSASVKVHRPLKRFVFCSQVFPYSSLLRDLEFLGVLEMTIQRRVSKLSHSLPPPPISVTARLGTSIPPIGQSA
jgi:hypothetical protein